MKTLIQLIKFLRERKREFAKMHHLETQEIVDDLYAIKTKNANFYVVRYDDGFIAIDAGGGNKNIAKTELGKLNIDPAKITTVLLTHSDFDHIAALDLFKNATIYLAKEELKVIDGSTPRMFGFNNSLKHTYSVIENDKEMRFGSLSVKPILTPGHTIGSMCYLLDNQYLFTGDTLGLNNGKAQLFSDLFNMDTEAQEISLNHLAQIENVAYIFTSHHGFTDKPKEALTHFR